MGMAIGLAASAAEAAACLTSTPYCLRFIALKPGERGLFYSTQGLDRPAPRVRRVLIMVHGALRNADRYFDTANAAAFLAGAQGDTLVIAPAFHSADGDCHDTLAPGEISWSCGRDSWRSGGAAPSDATLTSFGFMDALLQRLANRALFPNLRVVVVAGHSAGGQFVTRYEMASRVIESLPFHVAFAAANPSSYAWPSPERLVPEGPGTPAAASLGWKEETPHTGFSFAAPPAPPGDYDAWPMGLERRAGGYVMGLTDETLRRNLTRRDTTYLLSRIDVLPLGGFDDSPDAMAQGATRRQRGEAFADYLRTRMGATPKVVIVPECGHNDRCVYTTPEVLGVVFPKPR